MGVSRDTRKEIIKLIRPWVETTPQQKTFVNNAWFGSNITSRIDYGGNARIFAAHIVDQAIAYGSLEDGKDALVALLEEVKDIAPNRQEQIDRIIEEITPTPPHPYEKQIEAVAKYVRDGGDRRALITLAWGDQIPHDQITFGGDARTFAKHVVNKAVEYGKLDDGTMALNALLEAIRGEEPKPWYEKLWVWIIIGAATISISLLVIFVWPDDGNGPVARATTEQTEEVVLTEEVTPTSPSPQGTVRIALRYAAELEEYYEGGEDGDIGVIASFNERYCAADGTHPLTNEPLGYRICIDDFDTINSGGFADSLIEHLDDSDRCFTPGSENSLVNDDEDIPVLWQPSTARWLELVNYCTGQDVYNLGEEYNDIFVNEDPNGTNIARAATRQPGVVAIWESYYTPFTDGDNLSWQRLAEIGSDSNGWCSAIDLDPNPLTCAVPLYAHTDPRTSSTGLDMLMAQFYAFSGVRGSGEGSVRLERSQLQDAVDSVRAFQGMSRHNAATTLVFDEYLALGDDYLRFASLDENTVIDFNQDNPRDPLIAAIPAEGVFLQERPMGIYLGASADEKTAARVFVDFVLTEDNQQRLQEKGFRPADQDIADPSQFSDCDAVNCGVVDEAFNYYTPPSGEVINRVREMWVEEPLRRQTEVTLLLDVSNSVTVDQLAVIREAATEFIATLERDTSLRIVAFYNGTSEIFPMTPMLTEDNKNEAATVVRYLTSLLGVPRESGDPSLDQTLSEYPRLSNITNKRGFTWINNAILEEMIRIYGGQGCIPNIGASSTTAQSPLPANVIIVLSDGADTSQGSDETPNRARPMCDVSDRAIVNYIEDTWQTNQPVVIVPIFLPPPPGEDPPLTDRAHMNDMGEASFIVEFDEDRPENATIRHYFEVSVSDDESLSGTLDSIRRFFGL